LPRHWPQRRHPGHGLVVGDLAAGQEGTGGSGRIGGDLLNPLTSVALIADPAKAWPGWPNDAKMEELRAAFAAAEGLEEQKKAAAEVQKRALEIGTHVNLGTFFVPVGYRTNVRGMIPSPVQFFWNMEKTS
jgi:peptide/nickel transport system substrate-binding protein